ncbi:hypothetical protein QJS10_CPB17g01614 [Acorus calamus]|uniref:Uncharacterized protein n=1 Tax=Acorus calamus TaxID=4465 RepID=A0AAV9CRP0_ACOCL|nr:hypothetical protein QJS10_CPB17g01614 [Acorus calamus]
MTINAKEIVVSIKKILVYSTRITYRYSCNHPFVLGTALFFFLLYILLPSLFRFLVSSSPVISCTAVLLGALLSYGKPNIPEIEEEKEDEETSEISSLKSITIANNIIVESDESFPVVTHIESKRDIEETTPKDVTHGEEKVIEEQDFLDNEFIEKIDSSMEKPIGDAFEEDGGHSKKDINIHDKFSDSDSDGAESSSSDASMADIMPILNELHPLLEFEFPQPVLIESDSDAEGSSQDEVSDDGNDEESREVSQNQSKEDETKRVVKWTEDDEKNVMDLGTSELERNRRLENLIAKRRARKELERNLIDLGARDHLKMFHIPPVSTTRQNPFDLPYDSEVAPGSAPSVLLPRRNPFDLPYEEVNNRGDNVMEENFHVQHRKSYLGQHESFSLGASFPGEIMQPKRDFSQLGSYYQAERLTLKEETGCSNFQRQLSKKSDSNISSVTESESVSSTIEEKHYQDEPLAKEIDQDRKHVSLDDSNAKSIEKKGLSSEEADFTESVNGQSEFSINEAPETSEKAHLEMELGSKTDGDHVACPVVEEAVLEGKLIELSAPSFAEESQLISNTDEGGLSIEQTMGDSSKGSPNASIQPVFLDSDLISWEAEVMHDGRSKESIYNSSSSAIEKPLSNAAPLEDALFYSGSGSFNSCASALDMQVEISEVKENESRSRESNAISESDVIHPGFLGASEEYYNDSSIFGQISQEHLSSSLQTNALNLPSIPEEVNDNSKHEEEHEIASPSVLNASVTGLQIIGQADVMYSDIESELSILNNQHSTEMGGDDDKKSFTGLRILEPIDSMESSDFFEMKAEHLESYSTTSLSDEERTDGVTDESREMKPIDEGLLSELDMVGEYHVQGPKKTESMESSECPLSVYEPETVKADAGPSETDPVSGDPELMQADSEIHTIEAISLEDIGMAFRHFHEAGGETEKFISGDLISEEKRSALVGADSELLVHEPQSADNHEMTFLQISDVGPSGPVSFELVDDEPQLEKIEMSHSEMSHGEVQLDPVEITSDLHVIDATTIEDITLSLKPHSEDITKESFIESEVSVLEAKSSVDIKAAFEQVSEDDLKKSVSSESESEVKLSEFSTNEAHLELMESHTGLHAIDAKSEGDNTKESFVAELAAEDREPIPARVDSELLVLEANSVEDPETAVKEASQENPEKPVTLESEATPSEPSLSSEAVEAHSELHVIEVKSIEDIQLLLKPVHGEEISPGEQRSSEVESMDMQLETNINEIQSSEMNDLAAKESIDDPNSSVGT